jgi:hypothetical protein
VRDLTAALQEDQEADDRWYVLHVSLGEGVDVKTALAAMDAYTDSWLRRTAWPESNRVRISLDLG